MKIMSALPLLGQNALRGLRGGTMGWSECRDIEFLGLWENEAEEDVCDYFLCADPVTCSVVTTNSLYILS